MSTSPVPEPGRPEGEFAEYSARFTGSRRGAHQARLAAQRQLRTWGLAPGSDTADVAALIVAELAANAVTHGRVPGRGFELRLALASGLLRIDVTDAAGERLPPEGTLPPSSLLADSGRGLYLVDALATAWTVLPRPPGKTVRAELSVK